MSPVRLEKGSLDYPSALLYSLAEGAPTAVMALGNYEILRQRSMALFCSVKCPGSLILWTYDLAQFLRQNGVPVIGGFHSPMERECLTILLRGDAPIVICLARSIEGMRLPAEYKKPLDQGRLLILSPFAEAQRRPTIQASLYRNRFVAALADSIFVAYAAPSSKTEEFCRDVLIWGKPLYSFDNDANVNLLALGARPVSMKDSEEWLATLRLGRFEAQNTG